MQTRILGQDLKVSDLGFGAIHDEPDLDSHMIAAQACVDDPAVAAEHDDGVGRRGDLAEQAGNVSISARRNCADCSFSSLDACSACISRALSRNAWRSASVDATKPTTTPRKGRAASS